MEFFYKFVMPVITGFLLLFGSGSVSRPLFLGTILYDFLARLWIFASFSFGYIYLSNPDKFRTWFYCGRVDKLEPHNDVIMGFWNIGLGLMGGVFATVITRWIIQVFLPFLTDFDWYLAISNGLLFAGPLIYQHKRFTL